MNRIKQINSLDKQTNFAHKAPSLLTRHFFEIELAKHIPPGSMQDVDDQENVQIGVRVENNLRSDAVRNHEHHHDNQEVQQVNELQLHTETENQNISKLKRLVSSHSQHISNYYCAA